MPPKPTDLTSKWLAQRAARNGQPNTQPSTQWPHNSPNATTSSKMDLPTRAVAKHSTSQLSLTTNTNASTPLVAERNVPLSTLGSTEIEALQRPYKSPADTIDSQSTSPSQQLNKRRVAIDMHLDVGPTLKMLPGRFRPQKALSKKPSSYQVFVKGRNLRLWDLVADNINTSRVVQPLSLFPLTIKDVIDLPRARTLDSTIERTENGGATLIVRETHRPLSQRQFTIQQEGDCKFDDSAIEAISAKIHMLCERLPCKISETPFRFTYLITNAAILLAQQTVAANTINVTMPKLKVPTFRGSNPMPFPQYQAIINCFDNTEGTIKRKEFRFTVDVEHMRTAKPCPEIPDCYRWAEKAEYGIRESRSPLPLTFGSGEERLRHEKALSVAKWLTVCFDGCIGNVEEIKLIAKLARAPYYPSTVQAGARGGIYNGFALWVTIPAEEKSPFKRTRFRPSDRISNDTPNLPVIEIRSSLFQRVVRSLTAILETFMGLEGIKAAWRQGCVEADLENLRIRSMEPPILADCLTDAPCPSRRHVCRGCLRDHECEDFAFIEQRGARLCPYCQLTLPEADIGRECPSQPSHEVMQLRARLMHQIWLDHKCLGIQSSRQERKNQADMIMEQLLQLYHLPKVTGDVHKYRDAYVNQVLLDQDTRYISTSGRRSSPFVASVEGIYPFHVWVDKDGCQKGGYHVIGNCAVTSASMNFMKWNHGPISLKMIAQFRRAKTYVEVQNAFNGFVNLFANGHAIPPSKKARIEYAQSMKIEDARAICHVLKTGQLLEPNAFDLDRLFPTLSSTRSYIRRHDSSWSSPEEDWRWAQYLQIIQIYGFDVVHDIDLWTTIDDIGNRVIYPFSALSKDLVYWNRWVSECWFCERLERLDNLCDRHNPNPEATVATLTFIALHCRMRMLKRDRDRMVQMGRFKSNAELVARDMSGLEAVPFTRSPCTAVFAHKHHGRYMTDGFKTRHPVYQSLDFSFDDANIHLDTQTANWAVWEYDESTWPSIFEQLDHLRFDSDTFWPAGYVKWEPLIRFSCRNRTYIPSYDVEDTESDDGDMDELQGIVGEESEFYDDRINDGDGDDDDGMDLRSLMGSQDVTYEKREIIRGLGSGIASFVDNANQQGPAYEQNTLSNTDRPAKDGAEVSESENNLHSCHRRSVPDDFEPSPPRQATRRKT